MSLDMDQLSPHRGVLDCHANSFTLDMYGIPLVVVWLGSCSRMWLG